MSGATPYDRLEHDHEPYRGFGDADDAPEPLSDRETRALTESMTVLDASTNHDLAAHEYEVVTPSGTYRVDLAAESCTCPDAIHRGVRCKHRERVAFATGERPIPAWVQADAIPDDLGQHVAGEPHQRGNE